jgi:hypothetical protein
MGCCSGRYSKLQENLLKKKDSKEIVDKTYFSNVHSEYFSNKQNFYKKAFKITSVENKKLNEELE